MIKRIALAAALGPFLAVLAAGTLFVRGWWSYLGLEREIVHKMDQYYLSIASPGREDYLLESDENFVVPYMASRLSVEAVPTRIYDLNGRLMGEFSADKGLYVGDPGDLPVLLKRALVATEDGNFYKHRGVNWRAICRAALVNIRRLRNVQGGSTITQQLAKLMFTTRRKTLGRKVFELFCAWKLEQKFTKDQILLMYFNFAYFGYGSFGIEQASRNYFGKSTKSLELAEAAMLVGLIANPNRYSPFESLELAQARQRTVLRRMAKLGFVPDSSVERISEEFWSSMSERLRQPQVSFWKMNINEAPYAIEHVRRRLLSSYSRERLIKGGLKVYTTFDLEMQKAAERVLAEGLRRENSALAKSTGMPPIEGAMAAVRPADGAVLALAGGGGFNFQNQLIRAVDSSRPIGSAVKPFVFAAALDSGALTLDRRFEDARLNFKVGGGRSWSPENYGGKYYGLVDPAFALRKSLNSVAIQILKEAGVGPVIRLVSESAGVPAASVPRNLSLALGTVDLSALQLARAYGVLLTGEVQETYFIRYIEDRHGRVAHDERERPAPKRLLKPQTCAAIIELMKGTLGPEGTAYGAAQRTGFNIPAAGKTGTTNEYRDAWFAGVTADFAAAVWLGHDDMRIALGSREAGGTGGSVAAPIWMDFVKAAYRNRPTRELAFAAAP
ncbi:MAG: transglycosylase domain-containing protein [Elusimicrobia bacterium]|nr:transglycosylase domain-containing protein [Elusimicrobiota bacterium]